MAVSDTPYLVRDRAVEGTVLLNLLEQRVRELWKRRGWYASHLGWIPEQRTEDMAELRYLTGLLRKARAIAAPTVERMDPMTVAKADEWAGDHHVYPNGVGR